MLWQSLSRIINATEFMQSKNDTIKSWATKLDSHGRVVIPKELRDSKRLQHGDELVLILENGQIVLQTYEDAMQRLQDAFCKG